MITYDLAGKTALVTGGASGIGLATSAMLGRSGAKVAINFLADDPRGKEAVADLNVARGVFYRRADGERETKKQKPPVPLPPELHNHLRRWKRRGQRFAVEWYGKPVTSIAKAFRAVVKDAGLGPDVTPHVLRHTAATWLMQAGTDPWEAAGFLGMTVETLMSRYGHHHPDYLSGARGAFSRHRNRHRNAATEREQTEANVTKIAEFSKAGG
jgi:NAD(P)-dependent dehydrogenase (short-subunit alcohol dehydrogenase family)